MARIRILYSFESLRKHTFFLSSKFKEPAHSQLISSEYRITLYHSPRYSRLGEPLNALRSSFYTNPTLLFSQPTINKQTTPHNSLLSLSLLSGVAAARGSPAFAETTLATDEIRLHRGCLITNWSSLPAQQCCALNEWQSREIIVARARTPRARFARAHHEDIPAKFSISACSFCGDSVLYTAAPRCNDAPVSTGTHHANSARWNATIATFPTPRIASSNTANRFLACDRFLRGRIFRVRAL